MDAPAQSTMVRLRQRDGDACWLCGSKIDFAAAPNSKKAPTKEHLVPLSQGGTGALDNLVLCHPGCNRQLGDRAMTDKLMMRDRAIANRAKQLGLAKAAKKQAPAITTAPTKQPAVSQQQNIAKSVQAEKRAVAAPCTAMPPVKAIARNVSLSVKANPAKVPQVPVWQRIATFAIAAATFFAGLCLGMLIG